MRQVSIVPNTLYVGEYVVRQYHVSDAQALVDAVTKSCEHLRPWMHWIEFEPQSVHEREDLIDTWKDEWKNRSNFMMGVFLDSRVVGSVGIHLRGAANTVEIGYWVHIDYINRGIATKVSQALANEAFSLWPEIEAVEIHHDEANVASGKVPQKLGFEHVRTFRNQTPEAPGESGVGYHWALKREK